MSRWLVRVECVGDVSSLQEDLNQSKSQLGDAVQQLNGTSKRLRECEVSATTLYCCMLTSIICAGEICFEHKETQVF